MDKLRLLAGAVTLLILVSFIVFTEAKLTPSGTASQPVNPQLPTPSCTALRDLPVPSAPFQQIVKDARLFGKYISYSLMQQAPYSQNNLVLLDMGADHRLFTSDDSLQTVANTTEITIHDLDLNDKNLVWIEHVPGFLYANLKSCDLDYCAVSEPNVIFISNETQYLEHNVAMSDSRVVWTVRDPKGLLIMFCDFNKNGADGGCLNNDKKNVVNIYQQRDEYIHSVKTTQNFGYVLTKALTSPKAKLYIMNYSTNTSSMYYDEVRDGSQINDFFPISSQQNLNVIYMLENNTVVSVGFISDGKEIFQNRMKVLVNKTIDVLAADRNTKDLFKFAYLERGSNGTGYYIKTLSPPKSYNLDSVDYQQILGQISYSRNSFITQKLNPILPPAYFYCE